MLNFLPIFYLLLNAAFAQSFGPLEINNIHGKFLREQVMISTSFRAQIVGLIFDLDTKATCTGTLIGPRQVLTAAHCVYNFKAKTWSNLSFTPGKLSKEDLGFGSVGFKRVFLQKEYIDNMDEEFDFAVIELDKNIGDTLGWAGFRSLTKEELLPEAILPISFAGYPGDKDYGTQWKVSCPAVVKEKILTYYCDSWGGMSGSALFKDGDAQNFIIGVHTFGGFEKNGGVFLDSQNYILLQAWKNSTIYSANTIIHLK